ncbi:MAG TPA: pyruvate kinase [Polyangiaceae bacterium]|nr:pyruvate kinase [Polyangiaceae bacterium]
MGSITPTEADPRRVYALLLELRAEVESLGSELFARWRPRIERLAFQPSALNLAHYLILRRRDLRALQALLPPLGLSSLGRGEARVLANLDSVTATLAATLNVPQGHAPKRPSVARFYLGERLLERNARALFGLGERGRRGRILVTLPSEAAEEPSFIAGLVARGVDCFRINCAHDSPREWGQMIEHVHAARKSSQRSLRVMMDLAGPKLRIARCTPDRVRAHTGDRLWLARGVDCRAPSDPAPRAVLEPSEPAALRDLKVGDSLLIDDGKLHAAVEAVQREGYSLRVIRARYKGQRLAAGKSLNAPDIELALGALTAKDLGDLEFVADHADIIGYSFVQSPSDVEALRETLTSRAKNPRIPLILKIETARAVRNLPEIVVASASQAVTGVMIARGDLAVEIGYQRLAEIQEEILWICEAAHVPVVWATQVLEHLVKKGLPTRAEMTDAAMAERAECVMLNKGPYVAEAVEVLKDVLTRMSEHQNKKTPTLRRLHF